MDLTQISGDEALETALGAPVFLLFKHSLICPTSAQAFNEYRHFLSGEAEVPTAWLDVRGQRPLSQLVEARTGVQHESPQALLLKGGEVVWNASHGAITRESLTAAVQD
ncbi:MAG: bacillithiol system redox-active protein YtxJ [Planctomycetota bacterium]